MNVDVEAIMVHLKKSSIVIGQTKEHELWMIYPTQKNFWNIFVEGNSTLLTVNIRTLWTSGKMCQNHYRRHNKNKSWKTVKSNNLYHLKMYNQRRLSLNELQLGNIRKFFFQTYSYDKKRLLFKRNEIFIHQPLSETSYFTRQLKRYKYNASPYCRK